MDKFRDMVQKKLPPRPDRMGEMRPHRLDTRPYTDDARARDILDVLERSGVIAVLDERLHAHQGSKSRLTSEPLFYMLMRSMMDGSRFRMTAIAKMFGSKGAVPSEVLSRWPGLWQETKGDNLPGYEALLNQFHRLVDALNEGWIHCEVDDNGETLSETVCDWDWLVQNLLRASIPEGVLDEVRALAMDDFGIQTAARVRLRREEFPPCPDSGSTTPLEDDPMVAYQRSLMNGQDVTEPEIPARPEAPTRPKPGEWGRDGRRVYTADWDARASYMTSVARTTGHEYVGYWSTLAVVVPEHRWNGNVNAEGSLRRVTQPYIAGMVTTPAGGARSQIGVRVTKSVRKIAPKADDMIADKGFQGKKFTRPLHEMDFNVTMDHTVTFREQGGITKTIAVSLPGETARPPSEGIEVVWSSTGTLLHVLVPDHLKNVTGTPERVRCPEGSTCPSGQPKCPGHVNAVVQTLNQRAKTYRWSEHAREAGGAIRFRCPFCAGRAKSPELNAETQHLSDLKVDPVPPGDLERCCHGQIIRVPVEELDHYQKIPWGTGAWLNSYRRRLLVEWAIGRLRNRLGRGDAYSLCFGLGPMSLFSILASVLFNMDLTRLDDEPSDIVRSILDGETDGLDTKLDPPAEDDRECGKKSGEQAARASRRPAKSPPD
ncbi:MAG: hypothetical protein ACYDC0_13040 [Acidimicrobiales bacterium]